MCYNECIIIMESRIGSVSSGLGSNAGMRGQTLKSSPFCPPSTSKLKQSIIKDHMVSHYKKVYSAKAAIDTSVPKSLIHSVKYNDRIRQSRLRKEDRPQSAHSPTHRNTRASCSSAQSRLTVQYDDSPYLSLRSSMVSSPSTAFHPKENYSSYKVHSQYHSLHNHPTSQIKYRNSEHALDRKQSACSLEASGDQNCYKTFQDPVQKTYSGDLLQKHSQHFTQDKPFTPKTLKSDKSSYLSKYRYYRAPQRKPTKDSSNSRLVRQETYHGSTKKKEYSQEFDEPTQGFVSEIEWTENEMNGIYFSASGQHTGANKSRDHYYFDSSSREEELMYLEFISAVTEDILSRRYFSDRVLDLVIDRHIDLNRHLLDEDKMRHLVDVLRKDFEKPINRSTSSTELEKKENYLFNTLLPHLESKGKQVNTKTDNEQLPCASQSKHCDTLDYTDVLSGLTTLCSPAASPTKTNGKDKEDTTSPWLSEQVTDKTGINEEDFHQNLIGTNAISKENIIENQSVTTDEGSHHPELTCVGQSIELEDLGRSLSESLHVSNMNNNMETANGQHIKTDASVSDDDF
ncbi:spermatogenesis-associated protein 7 homolog isoform X2 [Channa argus]|uniref:spermatogenesis-associated protein 7 homolog isoform X2 n=1 Tax=Channa argus TaxID=215402 RepID=UPI00351FCF0A